MEKKSELILISERAMEEVHQTHLSNVLSFLHWKDAVNGFKPVRNAIQILLHRIKSADEASERKKLASRCSHCFTYWKEGNFSVKFKPKYKCGENTSKRMILKCLVCNHKEYQSYEQHAVDFRIERRKTEPITKNNKFIINKNNTTLKPKAKKSTTKSTSWKVAKETKNNSTKQSKNNKSKQKAKRK